MGSQEKSTTWVGNIYKKVGTFVSGIDNIISEESLQYAENQFLTAGANVKQFTENQILAAGANVKQFCSEFVQEILPEFLKDSSHEKTPVPEDTEKCDISSCEILKNDEDEDHKDEVSKSNLCDKISVSRLPIEHNHIKVTLIPSDIPQVKASERSDTGMTFPVSQVNQSHDGDSKGQIDLQSPKLDLSQPSDSLGGTAQTEDPKVDSLTVHQCAVVSGGLDECQILENEVSFSGIALSKALNESTEPCRELVEAEEITALSELDAPAVGKADQTKDNHSMGGTNEAEPLNKLALDCCLILHSDKICSASDFQVENSAPQVIDNSTLRYKFEKGWEIIQTVGYEDERIQSGQPRGQSLKQSLRTRESKYNNNQDSRDADWEIV